MRAPARTESGTPDSDRGATTVVTRLTTKRAARSGALWGVAFGVYVISSITGFNTIADTPAQRAKLAATFGTNIGLHAVLGTGRHIETVAGWTAYRSLGVLAIVGAIWGLLTATRLTRGEEDANRWELLLAGQTTRHHATRQAAVGLGAGFITLWTVTAAITVAAGRNWNAGFSVTGSLFLSLSLVASAGVFLAVGFLCAQLAGNRRDANTIAAGVFGCAYLLRMVADAGAGIEWIRWLSPLGWIEELHPLTGTRPLVLVPIIVLSGALTTTAIVLAGRRDLGASILGSRDHRAARTSLLHNAIGLATRLLRPVGIAWIAGMAVFSLVGGLVAQSASKVVSGSAAVERAMARLGAHRSGAASYLGVFFLISAAAIALAAAGQLAATRTEEAEGFLDHLLARPVPRRRWLIGRLCVSMTILLVAGSAAGLTAWVGAATQHSGMHFFDLAQAGLNMTLPALFVIGVGTLLYGLIPRLAPAATYALVSWSFLLQLIGSGTPMNHWLRDTSVFAHTPPLPAAPFNWTAAAWLIGLAAIGVAAGVVAFDHRDLVAA